MPKKLLIFIQSDNPGLYVNVLTHCVQVEGVQDIYFAVNEGDVGVGKNWESKSKIMKIKKEFEKHLTSRNEYKKAYNILLNALEEIQDKIVTVLFINPERSIKNIKNKKEFADIDNLIVDLSGCTKKVATDVISSYISSGINHVCCFELDDKVYSDEWKDKNLSKMYHDICDIQGGIIYYEYIDFSKSGTTIKSFNRMRSQGKFINLLLAISIILGVLVFVLIQQQQSVFAQYAAVTLALVTGLGLFNDIFGIADRLK